MHTFIYTYLHVNAYIHVYILYIHKHIHQSTQAHVYSKHIHTYLHSHTHIHACRPIHKFWGLDFPKQLNSNIVILASLVVSAYNDSDATKYSIILRNMFYVFVVPLLQNIYNSETEIAL